MDALEKAQRDRDREKGDLTEESLFHNAGSKRRSDAGSKRKIFKYVLFINIAAVVLLIVIVISFKGTNITEEVINSPRVVEKQTATNKERAADEKKVIVPSNIKISAPIYLSELVLDNGLKIKVDGVYLDNNIPYALIGPDIVKKGDNIEGFIKIKNVDFKKVEVEYKNSSYFLLVN